MKIVIGINNFKKEEDFNNREKMCVDSLRIIKQKYPFVKLVNVCFPDENYELKDFVTLPVLSQTNESYSNKKIPFVNEIFDTLANIDCDYFIFINNDVALSNRFVNTIVNNSKKDCFPASKLHFLKFDSINDPFPEPESVSVHGFDGFGIKNNWWKQNRHRFANLLLGHAYWDTYFFAKCMLYGDCIVLNKPPLSIFHLDHKSNSMLESSGNRYNETIFANDIDNLSQKWFSYVYNVLLKRETANNIKWYIPFANEEELEKQYFKL